MSAVSSAATQQKFTNLRKRLDQLGYRQPLGIESLPLVEKVFADLVHTTESLKNVKLQVGKGSQDRGNLDAYIEPYKSDNAKLVKENNELHQQLIKTKEDSEALIKDLKSSLRKIEHQNADLQFLNNQYVHKIRAQERESKQKSDRILQLQEKNFQAVVQTPGGRTKNIPFRRQRMELDCTVPPSNGPLKQNAAVVAPEDPYVADLLKVADENISRMKEDVSVLTQHKESLESKLDTFRKQVETRDGEIDRLSRMLEGGRPYDVVALEARNRSNERLISHLNIQIDYLQQKNQDLQRQNDDALSKARVVADTTVDLDVRNQELTQELQDVDRMAARAQTDKELAVRTADREIEEAKIELEKSRRELETMDLDYAQLKAEKDRLIDDVALLKGQMSTELVDRQRLEDLLDKVQEDKRKLSNRVNKLTSNERELVLEIDRLKHRNGMVKKRGKSPNRMDQFIRGLEEERDYWKGEVEVLQKLLRSKSHASSPTRSLSSTPSKKNKSLRSSSPTPVKGDKKGSTQLQAKLQALEDERDHYKRECDILKAMRTRSPSPSRTPNKSFTDESELQKVSRERDELQNLLDKFERHMSEIQANVKVLTQERDKLSIMYEETKEELTRLRREVVRSPKSPKTSLAAQAVLRRVENERDDAINDLRRMTSERDTLRERLKIATETQLADRARLEQRIEDLENQLQTVDSQKGDLDIQSKALQRHVDGLEDQVRRQAIQISQLQEDSSQHKATAAQMRLLAEQAERSLEDSQVRLTLREGSLRNTEEATIQLEQRLQQLQRTNAADLEEITRLRAAISSLDREKDALQSAVDDKTEKIVQLETILVSRDRTVSELNINSTELESALQRSSDNLGTKDREILSLRRQLDSTSEELTEVGRAREVALRENRRLQDDLATMTRENQNINQELQETAEEREQLKNQVQDYIVEVKRIEEVMSAKERERGDLLDQYRTLSVEAERYETQSHQLESEGSNLRLEIMTKEGDIRRLHEKIDSMDREIKQHLRVEQQYESQVSDLTRSVAALEDNLRRSEDEKHSIMQDLSAVRDLCARLEATKDALQRQLTNKTLDHEKLQTLVDDMKHETSLMRDQVNSERSSVQNLEGLLHNNREKEFASQLTVQEKDAEIELLKDRIALNDSKVESQNRELMTLRTRCIELESDIDRMRRQLTNEKFERERAVQELRRNGLAPPGESRLSRASPLSPSTRSRSPYRSTSPYRASSPYRSASPYRHSTLDDDLMTSTHTM